MFDAYLDRWGLTPDGEPLATPSSRLLPVRRGGVPAMLKVALVEEERFGNGLMVHWNGAGAARVLAHDDAAILLERGGRSLAALPDDEATRLVCAVAARLHAAPPCEAIPLDRWFRSLQPVGGVFDRCHAEARALLASQGCVVVLHGDLHHGNVLDFGSRGWLAIDPKRLIGERGFDFANLFLNPGHEVATAPGRLARLADVVSKEASLDRDRLLRWVFAYAGLSASWTLEDGGDPRAALAVAEIAAKELDGSPSPTVANDGRR